MMHEDEARIGCSHADLYIDQHPFLMVKGLNISTMIMINIHDIHCSNIPDQKPHHGVPGERGDLLNTVTLWYAGCE